MDRHERGAAEAARRTNGQAAERVCDRCNRTGEGQHRGPTGTSSTAMTKCLPCCLCGGDGYYFQVRDTVPALCMWELLGEPRPVCNASDQAALQP